MAKFDFRTDRKDLYSPSARDFSVVDVPEFDFLMVDGRGNPNTSVEYAQALEALYSLSYTVKFASKQQLGKDYVVGPLEGLWEADDPSAFTARAKDEWRWTMMIRQPEWLTGDVWETARAAVAAKGLPGFDRVRHETYADGRSVQIMHVGSYDDEGPVMARMHRWIADNAQKEGKAHHEVYIGDPRKSAPERLRTVLRQPLA